MVAVFGISSALLVVPATAQQTSYASRPITIIVPLAPGSVPDSQARLYMPRLSERLGVPVVVDNRPGASGNIGIELAAKAPGDGYTRLMVGGSFSISPAINKRVPYDPIRSFQPIVLNSIGYFVLAVSSNTRASSLAEFIADAKSRPGELNYASPGNGSVQHLTMELFNLNAGVNLTHVPYKGVDGAMRDLAGGIVNAMFVVSENVLPLAKSGRVRVLAALGPSRNFLFPDVPLMSEAGLHNIQVRAWSGLLAPASTPRDIVQKLNVEMNAVLRLPEIQDAVI